MPIRLPTKPDDACIQWNKSIGVRRYLSIQLNMGALVPEMVPPASATVGLRAIGVIGGIMIVSREGSIVMPTRETYSNRHKTRLRRSFLVLTVDFLEYLHVSMILIELYSVFIGLTRYLKHFVVSQSCFVVPIRQFDLQSALIFIRQPIEIFVSNPEVFLLKNIAETSSIFHPGAIERHLIALSTLNDEPRIDLRVALRRGTEDIVQCL